MRKFSRYLKPAKIYKPTFLGWFILALVLIILLILIYFRPIVLAFICGISILALIHTKSEKKRIQKLISERTDTICDFRRAFDVRSVDPWIIRATFDEFGKYFNRPSTFPLRADDDIKRTLNIDWDSIEDIVQSVADRAGYDLSSGEKNPLYGKVKTVKDFVMFFTYQPCTRDSEQADISKNSRKVGGNYCNSGV